MIATRSQTPSSQLPKLHTRFAKAATLSAIFALLASGVVSHAQSTVNWMGSTGTDWMTGGNWSSGTTPTSSDSVIIDTGTAVVTNGTAAVAGLVVGDASSGRLIVQGTGIVSGSDTLATPSNFTVAGNTVIGKMAGSTGRVTIGGSTQWKNDGQFIIGDSGVGSLEVINTAAVTSSNAIIIGNAIGSSGSASVANSGSWTNSGDLIIGRSGTGTLTMSGGVLATTGTTIIAADAGSNGTLNIEGGKLATAGIVKGSGNASINIRGGGVQATANNDDFFKGFGTLDINGNGIGSSANALSIGVDDGVTVTATNYFNFFTGSNANADSSTAFVKSGSGTLILTGTIAAAKGAVISESGTLIFETNSRVQATSLQVTYSGTEPGAVVEARGNAIIDANLWVAATGTLSLDATTKISGTSHSNAGDIIIKNHATTGITSYTLPGNINNMGNLRINNSESGAFTRLIITGTLSSSSGSIIYPGYFYMNADLNTQQSDKLEIGDVIDNHYITLNVGANQILPSGTSIKLVTSNTVTSTGDDIFVLNQNGSNAIESGVEMLKIYRGDGTAALPDKNSWYLAAGDQLSYAAQAFFATASVAGMEWFYQLDSVQKRLGEIRQEYNTSTSNYTGNLWVRFNDYRVNADKSLTSDAFKETVYSFDIGIDRAYRWEENQYLLGAFLDMTNASRDFDERGSGDSKKYGVGLYFTYLRDNGWYGDVVLKMNKDKNDITANSIKGDVVTADYDSRSWGASLEVGKQIQLGKAYWMEPSGQIAFAVINGASYIASNGLDVKMADSNVTQYRAGLRIGRNIPNSPIKPYIKGNAVKVDSSGGRLRAGIGSSSATFKPNLDGWRYEAGAGVAFIVDERKQFYFDYEYATADKYDRPWSINAGFRCMW